MQFLMNESTKLGNVYRRLYEKYGDETLSRKKIFHRCICVKEGCTLVNYDHVEGRSESTEVIP